MRFGVLVARMPALGRLGPEHRRIVLRRAGRGAAAPAVACAGVVAVLAFLNLWIAFAMFADAWADGRAGSVWMTTAGCGMVWLVGGLVFAPMTAGWVYAAIALRRINRWIRRGSCVACGYDLGASTDDAVCPECGAMNLSADGG